MDNQALSNLIGAYKEILIDLGTGDALFPYRQAKEDPNLLCLGIDPVAEVMNKTSNRIGRKPARGGVNNLLLMVASLESLPQALKGSAQRLTINFPWSALLRFLVEPNLPMLLRLRSLLKPEGQMETLLNLQVFKDDQYRQRLNLPWLDMEYVNTSLKPSWSKCGLQIEHLKLLGPGQLPIRTSWGQQLTMGSSRDTMYLRARAILAI